ncbi:superoxide dismutase family protein [Macromonas nakdongensis]|uniref:superoxide dismutase family protein n=1 Tax=Macromonas nakdongensis TaxID=1843082 RepID=UPI000C334082|nr:superoxide dismutase family protein [Macromonas nakdongensis]
MKSIAILSGVALAALAGCATPPTPRPMAHAQLEAKSGSAIQGRVTFAPHGEVTVVEAHIGGLTPGEHGFHVHEGGDCSAPDATSAKGHFNPAGKMHGHHHHHPMERHAGDLPNLVANAQGQAHYRAEVKGLVLKAGPEGILERSVVIHADPDDYKSQPAGNSGKRVACGVIKPI